MRSRWLAEWCNNDRSHESSDTDSEETPARAVAREMAPRGDVDGGGARRSLTEWASFWTIDEVSHVVRKNRLRRMFGLQKRAAPAPIPKIAHFQLQTWRWRAAFGPGQNSITRLVQNRGSLQTAWRLRARCLETTPRSRRVVSLSQAGQTAF